jgi:DNA polymerase-3 subunit delta'
MSFGDIKGQERSTQIIKGYLQSSALRGAYLFIGEEGIGKYLVARTLAKAINCLNRQDDSCDNCASCLKIEKRGHPDIHYIELTDSDNIKIEAIRSIKKDISLKPYEAKSKVFIINDAHNLTAEAAGALLKILEEPPKNNLIILVSSKPALLFKTIISRCKIIRFYPLKRPELKQILTKDYSLDDNLAHFLAYFSEGRIGKALKLKDADILKEKNRIIDEFTISRRPNLESLSTQDRDTVRSLLNILASWFRDMYLVKIGISHSELINLDRRMDLLRIINRYTMFNLDDTLKSISDSLLYLEQNVNIKLLLSNLKAGLWRG